MNSEIINKNLKKGYCSYNFDIADLIIPYTHLRSSKYNEQITKKGNKC